MGEAVQNIRRRLCRFCRRAARGLRDVEQPRQPAHWCGHGTEVRRGRGVYKAIRGQGTKFMTAMYHGISICTKRGNPANTFYGEPHNTDWDNPENEIDPNPCVANHRVFSHAWIDRARRFRTAGRKNSRKAWINTARSDVGRFRFEIHSRGLQARLSAYYYSRTATYAPPTSGTIWWWAARPKIRNRESEAT